MRSVIFRVYEAPDWLPLLMTYWLDDLLTPFAGTLRSIAFTTYESGN